MKKTTKNTATNNTINNTTKNTKTEEIMKAAEVEVEVKENNTQVEEKEKRVYRSFKDIILVKIDRRGKNLDVEDFTPIREKIAAALDELQTLIEDSREEIRTKRTINRRLAKFTKQQIVAYLSTLPNEQ